MKLSLILALTLLTLAGCNSGGKSSSESVSVTPGKVLIVIADTSDFYYQEYADPRRELEARGFEVVVAAGSTNPSMPHANTGQPLGDNGETTPDLAFTDVDSRDYQALVIAGGWGASRYYYGFDDSDLSVNNIPAYPRNAAHATALNDLINEFANDNKYVLAICNGVNVLAWSRVGGVSPLQGRNASAPWGPAPAQTYEGNTFTYTPEFFLTYGSETFAYCNEETPEVGGCLPMKKYVEDNGGIVAGNYSVGDPASPFDDVTVDGKFITTQDNLSAAAGGIRLARLILNN